MYESSDLTDAVVRALARELKVPESEVRAARSLREDLRMDSIAAVNVAFALEEEYNTEIEISEDDSFDTVDDIVAILQRVLAAR